MEPFGIYIRISQEGDRTKDEVAAQVAVYETACRDWAARNKVEVEAEAVVETDVSGALAADERELGELIRRVEGGEAAGILTPYLDRFGRDTVEGCLAYRRIKKAGGRLVCVNDGIDSDREGDETIFQVRMVFAEDYLRRVKANFQARIAKAAEEGTYLACRPPVGYVKLHEDEGPLKAGAIKPHPELKRLLRTARERWVEGSTANELAAWLREAGGQIAVPNPKHPQRRKPSEPELVYPLATITGSGVRHALRSRAYLGEAVVQSATKGETRTIKGAHAAIFTEAEWEEAQGARGAYHPNDGSLASRAKLSGLVRCPNGHRLKVGSGGGKKGSRVTYACTDASCDARVSIGANLLDPFAEQLLQRAVVVGVPEVAAVLDGDDRYQRGLQEIETAVRLRDEYRDDIALQAALGKEAYVAGLVKRTEAVEVAREAFRAIPKPKGRKALGIFAPEGLGIEQARAELARFINRIVVLPVGSGQRVPVAERIELYWVGAEIPADSRGFEPVPEREQQPLNLWAEPAAELLAPALEEDKEQSRVKLRPSPESEAAAAS
jgi:DNA invertase Pin-like site-specific DNA recombinase